MLVRLFVLPAVVAAEVEGPDDVACEVVAVHGSLEEVPVHDQGVVVL